MRFRRSSGIYPYVFIPPRPAGSNLLSDFTSLAQIMVSRLVLSLRKSADHTIDVTEFIAGELSFSPNSRLPVHVRSQLEFVHCPTSRSSDSSDNR